MRTGRIVVWLVVGIGILVAGSTLMSLGEKTFEPVEEAEEQALLNAVRTGCEAAASAVQSGVGVITIHDTMWQENGARRDTEATYQLVQRGERVRVRFETRTIADEWDAPDLNEGGRVTSSASRWSLGSDGEAITYYEPESKRATVGDRSSAFARLLESALTITHAPGHAIPASVFDPDEWSEWASPPHVLGRETVNGEECVVVQVTRERVLDTGTYARTYKYWIDPSRGFGLVRFENHLREAPSEESILMARFDIDTVPCGDGLWRISCWRQDGYSISRDTGNRYLSSRSTVTYSDDYQLNAPVTEEMLTIALPSGTRVHDEGIDAHYTVP